MDREENRVEEIRLNKYLAACGICSRRDADRLIGQGAVTVNGERAAPEQPQEAPPEQ